MATIKEDVVLKFRATVDDDVEDTSFSAGDDVELVQQWEEAGYCLIKDEDGHFYNIPSAKIDL
jgi:hypothetical protein